MVDSQPTPTCKAAEPTTADSGHEVLLHELAALRRSEAILRDFIETSTIGLHWVGAAGTILWVNQAELDLLGYSKEEYVGRNIAEFHADASVINDILGRLNRGETLRDYSARLRHRDGSIRHVLINSSVLFEDGKFVHTRCFTRDVTSTRQEQHVNRLLAAIVDSSNDAIFSKNLDGTIESWNAGAEKLFGYPAEEIIGKPLSVLLPPDRLSEFPNILARIRAGVHLEHYEVTRLRKDGRRVDVSVTGSPIRDSAGCLVGSSTIARDITDRRQADAALRRSEERFRLAIKATNDAIWDIDLQTGVIGWNDTYSTLYGRPPETSNSWQWWIDRIHPDDRERTVGSLSAAISADASSWTCEYRFRRVDGEWAHIYDRAYIARDDSGDAWRVIGAMQDLTERMQAEASLRESEERFRSTANAAPVIMWLGDAEKQVTFINREAALFTGIPAEKLSASGWAQVIHADDLETVRNVHYASVDRRVGYQIEYRARRADGEYRHMLSTASPRYVGHEYVGHAGSLIDITDLKLRQQEDLARRKWESIGTLAAGIAHDFNNLLGGVLAQAELALGELDTGSPAKEELRTIREVALRGSEIVRQLMTYTGQETAAAELVDLSQVVREMLDLLKISVSKHAVLETDLGRDLPPVRANSAQLRQVVMNLVTNASDAIGNRDGVIRISTRWLEVGRDSGAVSAQLAVGDYVQLEVSDTGKGMSLETQGKVFDPFFTTKSVGHGLGLAVVNGVVRAIGGSIQLTSEPGQGTTFHIVLPCSETQPGATRGSVAPV